LSKNTVLPSVFALFTASVAFATACSAFVVAFPFQVDERRSYLLASASDPLIFGLGVPVGYILRADKLY